MLCKEAAERKNPPQRTIQQPEAPTIVRPKRKVVHRNLISPVPPDGPVDVLTPPDVAAVLAPLAAPSSSFRKPQISLGKGATCHFIGINDVGFKIYGNRETRDFCFSQQQKAAKAGLAPQAWHKFEAKTGRRDWGIGSFGFTTELAEHPIPDGKRAEGMEDLEARLREAGLRPRDMHAGNIGLLRGKVVCIDFSHFGGGPHA